MVEVQRVSYPHPSRAVSKSIHGICGSSYHMRLSVDWHMRGEGVGVLMLFEICSNFK